MPSKHRILYISHGGGPLPVLGDAGHKEMVANLRHLASTMPKPSAILLVSAHWEEPRPTVTIGSHPPLYYDYYGFPQESYELAYPAPGDDALAEKVHDALEKSGLDCGFDPGRGFDHALFIPLMLMYPEADVPCVELSLIQGLTPAAHIALGEALAGVEHQDLLIIGSGFSFHNMNAFFTPDTEETQARNNAFDAWLTETCCDPTLPEIERRERLLGWEAAPYARYCHPREEHLLPLLVCYGTAGRACSEVFKMMIMNKKASAFRW